MNRKLILGAALMVMVLIFSVQNAGTVEVQLLMWRFPVSLAVIIFSTLGTGLVGGWAVTRAWQRRPSSHERDAGSVH